ncbi:class I SAM-dependent methyltransferase [Streptomyces sp. KL116D]|uniref:class I SAM-dependent methyltransferase n=1 Tax=Streptomyces sp. KL116D TaxID=3045152 RepID=UPI0035571895
MPETIVSLVQTHHARPDRLGMVLDIGCGRGTSNLILAEQLRPEHVVGLDAAPPCSHRRASASRALPEQHGGVRRRRLPRPPSARQVERCRRRRVLPLPLAAPQDVVGQIARVLAPGGVAVLVTKGLDSYREMDQLVARAGLDPRAAQHESLYTAAHSDNWPTSPPLRST